MPFGAESQSAFKVGLRRTYVLYTAGFVALILVLALMEVLGMPLLDEPDLLVQPTGATRSAVWYWVAIDGNSMADEDSEDGMVQLTRALNGGESGIDQRLALWRQARALLVPVG